MKKRYTFVCIMASFLSASLTGQVATMYTFSQFSGNFTAITGGTVFGTTTSDDQTFVDPAAPAGSANNGPGIPIGFDFMFNNNIYDRIGINNNGWMGFGHSSMTPAVDISNTGGNYLGISTTSNAPPIKQNRVVALGRDIQAQSGSSLRVETIGSAPTRTCVIQFLSYKKYGTGGTGDDFNFQIRLMETTNIVEIIYGTFVNNATAGTAEVGLRGNSNGDYNNRIVNNTNPWNASIPGTANTSVVNFNNSGLTPASGQVYRWTPPQCSGSLSNLAAVSVPTLICPNTSGDVFVPATSSLSGLTYTWYVSTMSPVGVWTLVPGIEGPIYTTPGINVTTWYYAEVECLHSSSTTSTTPAEIQVAATTLDNVPYFEDFEGIAAVNRLPNCSWWASGLGTSFQTYLAAAANNRVARSGTKFAAFAAPVNSEYVYTNGIWMEPGITYSAAVHYATDFSGQTNWTDLSLLIGTAQTPANLDLLASLNPAVGGNYSLLSDTFKVQAPGYYYIAIRATGLSGGAPYLMIDDVSVTIPCEIAGNSPTINVAPPNGVICAGKPFNVTVTGADLYNNNLPGPVLTFTPGTVGSNVFQIAGQNTLTQCFSSTSLALEVQATPFIGANANPPVICAGKTAVLTAFGADSYAWNPTAVGQLVSVQPSQTSNYTVVGTNLAGCSASAVIQVSVNPKPHVTANVNNNSLCENELAILTADGAVSYIWKSYNSPNLYQGQVIQIITQTSDSFTVTGTDQNGCESTASVEFAVSICPGFQEYASQDKISVLPNPSNGLFTVNSSATIIHAELHDLSGRLIATRDPQASAFELNLTGFDNGVYFLTIQTETGITSLRLVKE